jgi:hypothetical protein
MKGVLKRVDHNKLVLTARQASILLPLATIYS